MKNLVEYVGKHGLFSSVPNVDIKQAQEEIANCKGNIWTHVISLRREDADALGYRAAQAYYTGTGMEQDYAESVKWYEKAAAGGDAYAMYALGKMYRDGIGVDGNAQSAYKYFLSAAELRHEFAQYAVAKALLTGEGVDRNVSEAIKWFGKCAEKGNHFAEYQLAVLFSEGKEVPKDEIKAQKYYAAALAGMLHIGKGIP